MWRAAVAIGVIAFAATPSSARAGQLARRGGLYVVNTPTPTSLASSASRIELAIRGPLITGTVTQTFRNDADHVVEATYIFPLPDDAAVSAMAVDIGSRHVRAQIARRADAAQRYEDAIAAGAGAGLLEQERDDVFTETVSAIPAHGAVTVTLRFDCAARAYVDRSSAAVGQRGDSSVGWELALPLVIAPRVVPGTASGRATTGTGRSPDTDRAPDASRVTPGGAPDAGGSIDIALEFADDVDQVTSPTHKLGGSGRSFTVTDSRAVHDVVVRWQPHDRGRGWLENDGDATYAAIEVTAPPAAPRAHGLHVMFVIDRAVTTRGDGDAVLRPLAHALVGAADASDRIALAGMTSASEREPEAVRRALDDAWTTAGGARDLTAELAGLHAGGLPIVLASDGLVADDRAVVAAAKKLGTRVFVIGVGPAPNRALLAAIARATGGTLRFATVGDDLAAIARDVLADAASPPAPIAVTWGALQARRVEPAALVLGAGQGAIVVAQVAAPDARHAQNARAAGGIFELATIAAPRPPEGATSPRGPLARWWARARLAELVVAGDRAAIAAHALAWGLMSPETSMIAVGDEIVEPGGVKHTIAVPVSVPTGMHWHEVDRALAIAPTKKLAKDANKDEEKSEKAQTQRASARHHAPSKAPAGDDEDDNDDGDDDASRPRTKAAANDRDEQAPKGPPAQRAQSEPTEPARKPGARDVATAAPDSPAVAPAPAPAPIVDVSGTTTTGDAVGEEVLLSAGTSVEEPGHRLELSLGGGLAITAGHVDATAAVRAGIAWGWPLAFGVEGALWDVGALHLEGDVMATFERLRVRRWLALGAGLGIHLGDQLGPAVELQLRVPLPRSRWSSLLRYDGALLLDNGTVHGEHVLTLGVELGF